MIKKIMELANKGYCIDYEIHDTTEDGNKQIMDIPDKTYTVFICPKSSFHDALDSMSFDDLGEGLGWAIKEVEKMEMEK